MSKPIQITIQRAWWSRLVAKPLIFSLFEDHIRTSDRNRIELSSTFRIRHGFLGSQVLELFHDGRVIWKRGFCSTDDVRAKLPTLNSPAVVPRLQTLSDLADNLFASERYLSKSEFDSIRDDGVKVGDRKLCKGASILHPHVDVLRSNANRMFSNPDQERELANQSFVTAQLEKYEEFFDQVESNPLTHRQRISVLGNDDANLVVAGAGTGKTSVIVARIAYLLKESLAAPHEILTLAFAKDAQKEIEERAEERIGDHGAKISTFHALGYQIIGQVEGKRPSISPLAESKLGLKRFITKTLERLAVNPASRALEFMRDCGSELRSELDFESLDQYHQYVRSLNLVTLSGIQVKSQQEVQISNWLTKYRVPFTYEGAYAECETATVQKRQYQPDFCLTKGVYLEHFAVAPNEREPGIFKGYKEVAKWKRKLHRNYGTRLFETYSRDFPYGNRPSLWQEKLINMCSEVGISLESPMSEEEQLELLNQNGTVDSISDLFIEFISLFKESDVDLDTLRETCQKSEGDLHRHLVFIDVFEEVLREYESELKRTGSIDFTDMIGRARSYVETGRFVPPWSHVIIDEFQDITRGRAKLLSSIQAANPHTRIFAVGDDWQSIFRFAGSDVAVMARDFSDFFGHTRCTDLDKTFRYGKSILDTSSKFISKNPDQLKKKMVASRRSVKPGVRVVQYGNVDIDESQETPRDEEKALQSALNYIKKKKRTSDPVGVLLLGRYNWNRDLLSSVTVPSGLNVSFKTCHRAKGLEDDYAIVCGLRQGKFPSDRADDPILDLVLRPESGLEYAEERRLFYVAITRAKKECILIAPQAQTSSFVEELHDADYASDVIFIPKAIYENARCPICSGKMLLRNGPFGQFWSCHNYPRCLGKCRTCPKCNKGAITKNEAGELHCSLKACDFSPRACPVGSCDGFLVKKTGKYGEFTGCSEWRRDSSGCKYTE